MRGDAISTASRFVFRFVFCDRNHIPRAHAYFCHPNSAATPLEIPTALLPPKNLTHRKFLRRLRHRDRCKDPTGVPGRAQRDQPPSTRHRQAGGSGPSGWPCGHYARGGGGGGGGGGGPSKSGSGTSPALAQREDRPGIRSRPSARARCSCARISTSSAVPPPPPPPP